MDKRLKIGLILMVIAVVLMPVSFLFSRINATLTIIVIGMAMLAELIGLILVISRLVKRK